MPIRPDGYGEVIAAAIAYRFADDPNGPPAWVRRLVAGDPAFADEVDPCAAQGLLWRWVKLYLHDEKIRRKASGEPPPTQAREVVAFIEAQAGEGCVEQWLFAACGAAERVIGGWIKAHAVAWKPTEFKDGRAAMEYRLPDDFSLWACIEGDQAIAKAKREVAR